MESGRDLLNFANYPLDCVPQTTRIAYEILQEISQYLHPYDIDGCLSYIASGEEDLAFYGLTAPLIDGNIPLTRTTYEKLCRFGESIPTPSYIFLELTGEDLTPEEWLQLEKFVVD
jgi:hypothetical protein